MKTRNILAALTFLAAIGSAVASEYAVPTTAWSKKIQVPNQLDNCEIRSTCSGGMNPCRITFDHDGNASTPAVTADLYEAGCVQQLTQN